MQYKIISVNIYPLLPASPFPPISSQSLCF